MLLATLSLVAGVAISQDLVATPCGVRPRECVLEVESGSLVEEGEDGLIITHPTNGRTTLKTPAICHQERFAPRPARGRWGDDPSCDEEPCSCSSLPCNNWIDNAGFMTPRPVGGFSGLYTVPDTPPSANTSQTIFYFIGAENTDGTPRQGGDNRAILQPVLTYAADGYCKTGTTGWCMSSWYCCPANVTTHSTYIQDISPGDIFLGKFNLSSADEFQVISENSKTGERSVLSAPRGSRDFNWADVTLEVYDMDDCSFFPTGHMAFQQLSLWDTDMQSMSPNWLLTGDKPCQGSVSVFWGDTIIVQHAADSPLPLA